MLAKEQRWRQSDIITTNKRSARRCRIKMYENKRSPFASHIGRRRGKRFKKKEVMEVAQQNSYMGGN